MRGTLQRALAATTAVISAVAVSSPTALAALHRAAHAASQHAASQHAAHPHAAPQHAASQHAAPPHAAHHSARPTHRSSQRAPALSSPQLWATIDVCRKGAHPVVGVRGSMPSDGHGHDAMYMRFGIEYLDAATGRWAAVGNGSEASYTRVGTGLATRQAGRDFHLASPSAAGYQLRGVVEYEWRRASRVVLSAKRHTTARHGATVLHAEPSGFSAADCTVR
ncbi:MAG: hypothetical protein ACYCUM_05375 [Solirubrobacteraceae bacterium]